MSTTSSAPGVVTDPGPVDPKFQSRHVVESGAKFADVQRLVREAGLMDLRPGRYVVKIAVNAVMLIAGVVAAVLLGASWWQMLVAVWLGFWGGQSSFLWHDAAHKSMFRSRRAATVIGRIHANLVNGVNYGWWVSHHNRHHSFPNHLEDDPDIGRRTVIFDDSQYAARTTAFQRFVVHHQHVMFFVLLVLEGLKMNRTAFVQLRSTQLKNRALEGALLVVHHIVLIGGAFLLMTPLQAVCFILLEKAVLGFYFGMLFAPNHKGMPVRRGVDRNDWLDRQVLTSRNIKPSPFIDFLYGGLNYQVEHHLFPAMPQMNLGACRTIVRKYCADHGIPYHEVGFWQSYREVGGYLRQVSRSVTAAEAG